MEENNQQEWVDEEVWAKIFFNGYFFTFQDMQVQVEIRIEDTDKATRILIMPGIDEENGKVDITALLHTYIHYIKENPGKKVSAALTSFGRQMHFDKDLLSHPIPQGLLDMFKLKGKDANN